MGFLGLGSTITMLRMKYGDPAAVEFTEEVARQLALAGWEEGLELAQEKGPAPIMNENFEVTEEMLRKRPEMRADGYQVGDKVPGRILHARYSRYMQRVAAEAPELVNSWPRTVRALHITVRLHRQAQFLCRWRTMPVTVSSRALRITISATSFDRARRPKKKSMFSRLSCWLTGQHR